MLVDGYEFGKIFGTTIELKNNLHIVLSHSHANEKMYTNLPIFNVPGGLVLRNKQKMTMHS